MQYFPACLFAGQSPYRRNRNSHADIAHPTPILICAVIFVFKERDLAIAGEKIHWQLQRIECIIALPVRIRGPQFAVYCFEGLLVYTAFFDEGQDQHLPTEATLRPSGQSGFG